MSDLTEREAVERCKSGDPGHVAFRALYEMFSPEVFGFLKNILKDAESAEDACQETFFRLHKGLANFDATRPLRPYVLQVARNVAIDVIRVRRRKPRGERIEDEAQHPADGPRAIDDASVGEARDVVAEAFTALGPEPRALLALRFMHELSYEDLAAMENVTIRTIGNRLRAAVALLSRELVRRGAHNLEVRP
jgi:RNA polymerase sigma factor (sigma-70 family)